ncbi:MAG: hypothetical protein DSY66_02435 [Persephonella sp.]|nr:MAG: hypothetical protein DSY53_01650 [Persephonella sp.]RUM61344.1 MAG: hypothetical protein DSY66_02435 [Persephonella sp.]
MFLKLKNILVDIKLELGIFFQFLPALVSVLIIGFLITLYSYHYMKLEKNIAKKNQNIIRLQTEIVSLQEEKAELTSPKKVGERARKYLQMDAVNLDKVKFLINE